MQNVENTQEFRLIPLCGERGKGLYAKVSPHRYEYLSQFRWHWVKGGYAKRDIWANGRNQTVLMHCEIMGRLEGHVVDHIDGDKLNNTDENLRLASKAQNGMNWHTPRPKRISTYYGVSRNRRSGKWTAEISHDGERIFIGTFLTEEEAVRARDGAAIALHGEFAKLSAPHLEPLPYTHRPKRKRLSKFTGVAPYTTKGQRQWRVQILVNGKTVKIGIFDSETKAALAREAFILRSGASRLRLNFA